ncbi:hypothetical protein ACVWXO_005164 [Bradyrhizobium sp. LM2.7]
MQEAAQAAKRALAVQPRRVQIAVVIGQFVMAPMHRRPGQHRADVVAEVGGLGGLSRS